MNPLEDEPWSPANNPYAIAVSEGWWWLRTAALCGRRIRGGHDPDRQIDARLLVLAMSLLVRAAEMEAAAIQQKDERAGTLLKEARTRFLELVPGLSDARNILTHFDDYARGEGSLQRSNDDRVAAARQFYGFGYDPATGSVIVGPYQINVDEALGQARQLFEALYAAARALDGTAGAPP